LLVRAGLVPAAECPPAAKPFTPELFAQAAKHATDRGMLWTIAKDDRVSYLYGTLHVGREEWMAPGPALQKALRETELIALELDPLDARVQVELAEASTRIKRNLPAPLKTRLKAALDKQCLRSAADPSELDVVALTLALGQKEGFSPVYGSEILLSVLGQGLQRPVVSLETVALQLRAVLGQDDAEAARFIEDSLDDIDGGKFRPVLMKSAAIWERGDLAQLGRYAEWCECVDTAVERKFMARLIDDRNLGLAQGIDALHMKGQKVFAAVGAMHMVGPAGLPALLAQRGYRVQRVR
jgi:uncharacterized protein YbaP (TraB family)